ncbi:MAG: hypothetical protein ACKO2D_03385 [Chloroflexota bacterium]
MDVPRACIAIPGVWTDHWFDAPDAWWAWACAWAGWTVDDWRTFRADWDRSGRTGREALMRSSGVRFLDWRQVPGGSMFGKVDAAAAVLKGHLDELPPGTDVTLIGHSKGGNVIKRYLTGLPGARHTHGMQPAGDPELANLPLRTTSVRAVMICAPVDLVREIACAALGFGIRPTRWPGVPDSARVATVNNWLDPSGGRLHGVRNYQVRVWNDHFVPWPPHGMKSFLARRVLTDLGAIEAR